jgi:hypothetical protein
LLLFYKSAKDTSKTLPFRLSAAFSNRGIRLSQRCILTLPGSLVAGGDGGYSHIEYGGHVHVVPFLLLEGVGTKRVMLMEIVMEWWNMPTSSSSVPSS